MELVVLFTCEATQPVVLFTCEATLEALVGACGGRDGREAA